MILVLSKPLPSTCPRLTFSDASYDDVSFMALMTFCGSGIGRREAVVSRKVIFDFGRRRILRL